jgi:hypothetical protein
MSEYKVLEDLIGIIEKINKEYLLINRLIYKTKNQFRRQKHFQLLQEIYKLIKRGIVNHFQIFSTNFITKSKLL